MYPIGVVGNNDDEIMSGWEVKPSANFLFTAEVRTPDWPVEPEEVEAQGRGVRFPGLQLAKTERNRNEAQAKCCDFDLIFGHTYFVYRFSASKSV